MSASDFILPPNSAANAVGRGGLVLGLPATPETDEIVQAYEDQRASVGGIIEHAEYLERERDALRAALAECAEDSKELLAERGWWKDEPRCGYAKRYEETAENIRRAASLLPENATAQAPIPAPKDL